MNADFIPNLKLLCSYERSVSDVCRKLQMNRQQFMKYLAGSAFPSNRSLRRICDHFGVDDYEILMPHEQFREIIRLRPVQNELDDTLPPMVARIIRNTARQHSQMAKYDGYYYKYFYSFSTPSYILRSLVSVKQTDEISYYKTIERLTPAGYSYSPGDLFKYSGIMLPVGDRIHMLDYESVVGNEMSQTILYPPYRNRVSILIGLMMGITATEAHQPVSTRVVMEYLGRRVDRRRAIRGCGLYGEDAPEISRSMLNYLKEPNAANGYLLRAGSTYDKVPPPGALGSGTSS
ncbi:predicted transcriptional regulator [Fulvimarina pelagi HTCC2506]|uniref:Predicted transcriptional regulator n=1 Tax=Fulvimarina pelagi HTCC2506 TaxID=314231 RepID=Q0FY57_9HYPH|nr:transcriptional regulator [Fulvimarina pelagi]EAU39885.1 predicted transcriptional regulator [Fulvimarina pelagi HTCC2506]